MDRIVTALTLIQILPTAIPNVFSDHSFFFKAFSISQTHFDRNEFQKVYISHIISLNAHCFITKREINQV